MIRIHENPLAFKAGAFSALIHIALLAAMLISFNTQPSQVANVAQVELWDNLPNPVVQPPAVKEIPKPVVKEEPKEEPKPETMVEKADIEIKKKPVEKILPKPEPVVKKVVEKPKPDPAIEKEKEKQKRDAALKALQNDVSEDATASDRKAQLKALAAAVAAEDAKTSATTSAASAGEIDKYKALILAKIQRNVNKQVCGSGNPELVFTITLLPTGEVGGTPKLVKSSGLSACDDAVERAVLQSQPLPLPPPDAKLFSKFRDLTLKFHPNEGN